MPSHQQLIGDFERLYADVRRITEHARSAQLYGVERTLLHMISHVQTILESLKETRAGFSV